MSADLRIGDRVRIKARKTIDAPEVVARDGQIGTFWGAPTPQLPALGVVALEDGTKIIVRQAALKRRARRTTDHRAV